MALMSMLITDPTIDRNKCIKMSLVHDLPEVFWFFNYHICFDLVIFIQAIVGDIIPESHSRISKSEKQKLEQAAMTNICDVLRKPSSESLHHEAAATVAEDNSSLLVDQPASSSTVPISSRICASSLLTFADELRSLWEEYEAGTSLFYCFIYLLTLNLFSIKTNRS